MVCKKCKRNPDRLRGQKITLLPKNQGFAGGTVWHGSGFSVMKKQTFRENIDDVLYECSPERANQNIEKIIIGSKYQLQTTPNIRSHDKPKTFLQYTGNLTQNFACKLKKLSDLQLSSLARKLRSFLPTLDSSFDVDLKSHILYEIKCTGCKSIYVGQTSRHVETKISEHQRIFCWI